MPWTPKIRQAGIGFKGSNNLIVSNNTIHDMVSRDDFGSGESPSSFQTATGKGQNIALAQGDNLIVVTASDADGLTVEDQISVRYDTDGSNGTGGGSGSGATGCFLQHIWKQF